MSESDKRRDDDQGAVAPVDGGADWNTPAIEDDADELPVAVRRVLATDQHLSQRRVFFGHAGADEDEPEGKGEAAGQGEAEAPQ
jgi:hypothetical protein